MIAEEKKQSKNEAEVVATLTKFYVGKDFPFFDNNPQCQITYEFCKITTKEVQAMPANKQRYFVMTSKGMTQRKCLNHLTSSCIYINFMNTFYKKDGVVQELPFTSECQIEWIPKNDGNSFEYKCILHKNEPCFSCVNYSTYVRSKPFLPLLTQSTYKLLTNLRIYEHGFRDKPSLKELLFFVDHMNVYVPKDVRHLCEPMQLRFEQCNKNLEQFVIANAPFTKCEHQIKLWQNLKPLLDTFDRTCGVCCIENCICKDY